ncbi:MAG TPA: DUF1491 family protein [Alphaproteobacteria bacterium]|nr:DUF1491 family protein [Alphaproteobacteria bacterium]
MVDKSLVGDPLLSTDDRLPTELWLKAHLRRCNAEGTPVAVLRRGDPIGGMVLLKINRLEQGCALLSQTRDPSGRPAWLQALAGALVPETEADAYIARAVKRDPDLWVIEIESRGGEHPFEGRIL